MIFYIHLIDLEAITGKKSISFQMEADVWERFKEVCKSQGSNASTELRRHIIETVRTAEARSDSEQIIKKETL